MRCKRESIERDAEYDAQGTDLRHAELPVPDRNGRGQKRDGTDKDRLHRLEYVDGAVPKVRANRETDEVNEHQEQCEYRRHIRPECPLIAGPDDDQGDYADIGTEGSEPLQPPPAAPVHYPKRTEAQQNQEARGGDGAEGHHGDPDRARNATNRHEPRETLQVPRHGHAEYQGAIQHQSRDGLHA